MGRIQVLQTAIDRKTSNLKQWQVTKIKLGAHNKMILREKARVRKENQWLCEKAIAGEDIMIGNSSKENRRN